MTLRPISPHVVALLFTLGLVGLFARPAAAADWTAAPADTSATSIPAVKVRIADFR